MPLIGLPLIGLCLIRLPLPWVVAAGPWKQLVEAAAIGLGDRRHIGGLLKAPFNLEAGDAEFGQLGDQLPGCQVLGRQQVALVAKGLLHPIHNQFIRQPAGLGTFTPVGTALAEGLTG